jgi:ketosteroid isomerase-like protein
MWSAPMIKIKFVSTTIITIASVLMLSSCGHMPDQSKHGAHKNHHATFDADELRPVIEQLGKQWSEGLEKQDINIFLNLYDLEAHYLPNDDEAVHGNQAIAEYWQTAFGVITSISLNMESLEGNKQLLYETGNGIAEIKNDNGGLDTFSYKYVNVWKLQADGSYKVVIDTFNAFPAN